MEFDLLLSEFCPLLNIYLAFVLEVGIAVVVEDGLAPFSSLASPLFSPLFLIPRETFWLVVNITFYSFSICTQPDLLWLVIDMGYHIFI